MNWILGLLTKNPMVLIYVAIVAFTVGVAVGAVPAWKYQSAMKAEVQASYDSFVAKTKAIGVQASIEAEAKNKENELIKERYDEQQKSMANSIADLSDKLYNSRSRGSYLPTPSPNTKHPERVCFTRTKFDAAMGQLDAGGKGLIDQGDSARVSLYTTCVWSHSR